jgi:hypothetical protein
MDDKTTVGRITFGPVPGPAGRDWNAEFLARVQGNTLPAHPAHPCNCIGPQMGQTKCPCALRAESEQGSRMVRDGVTINGCRYKLVPED